MKTLFKMKNSFKMTKKMNRFRLLVYKIKTRRLTIFSNKAKLPIHPIQELTGQIMLSEEISQQTNTTRLSFKFDSLSLKM